VNDLTLQLNGISVQLRGLQADTNHLGDSNQALVHQALLLQVWRLAPHFRAPGVSIACETIVANLQHDCPVQLTVFGCAGALAAAGDGDCGASVGAAACPGVQCLG